MRRPLNAAWILAGGLAACLVGDVAHAEPLTIWVQDDAPDGKVTDKADVATGGTAHTWAIDLRYPPEPETPSDQTDLDGLLEAIENGKARWEEFEIELLIAQDLQLVLDDVSLVRSDRDVEDLVRALTFQGTAVARAFDLDTFGTDERAAPFRWTHDGKAFPRPWVDAYALSGAVAERGDVVDGTGWQHYQRFLEGLEALPKATFTAPTGVGSVYLDGTEVPGGETREVPPGHHYVHVVRGGVVHARSVLDVGAGEAFTVPMDVSDDDLAATAERVWAGKASGLPDSILVSAEKIQTQRGAESLYLAATDGKKVAVLPLDATAELKDTTLVTAVLFGEVGAGAVISNDFQQNAGSTDLVPAPAASAGVGAEIGISYFALGLGMDAAFTPGFTQQWDARAGATNDTALSVIPTAWAGLGVYALRPTKSAPTLSILGTVGYSLPFTLAYGGRIGIGIPIRKERQETSWVRISLNAHYAPDRILEVLSTPNPQIGAFLRVGFQGALQK